MSGGLPKGWAQVPLGDVVEVHDARRVPVNAEERARRVGPYPYYGANSQAGTIDDFLFDGEFALLAEDGGNFDDPSRGVAYRVTGQFWVNNHAHVLAPRYGMETKFLVAALNALDWMPHVSGTTRLKLTQGAMVKAPFRLPPLNEQRRIVAKLEALQARSRRAREALDAVPPLLEKLRQSILAAAFRGDLTKDWRAKHKNVEPASELLKRIRTERRKKWEESELAKMKAKGKAPTDDKWKAKYKEPEPVDTTGLPELPEGWCWASVEELSVLVTDGDHNPPKRVPSGIPHLTAKNIKNQRVIFDGCSFVTDEGFEQTRQRYEPLAGDIIVTCVGTLGETAIVPPGIVFSADRNLAAIRLVPMGILAEFALRWLNTMWVQRHLGIASGSTAQPHLYLNDLRALAMPIAPVPEQSVVVDAVAEALARSETTLRATGENMIGLTVLERSVLAKAFRGELAPQDPHDEPAEAMLARVRDANRTLQLKANAPAARRGRRTERNLER